MNFTLVLSYPSVLQDLVMTGLNGVHSNRNNTEISDPPGDINGSELEDTINSARMLVSRFNHKCERCSNLNQSNSSPSHYELIDHMKKLCKSKFDDALESEIGANYTISESETGRLLHDFCSPKASDMKVPDIKSLESSLSPVQIPVTSKTLPSSSIVRRVSPFTRLPPLKMWDSFINCYKYFII